MLKKYMISIKCPEEHYAAAEILLTTVSGLEIVSSIEQDALDITTKYESTGLGGMRLG